MYYGQEDGQDKYGQEDFMARNKTKIKNNEIV